MAKVSTNISLSKEQDTYRLDHEIVLSRIIQQVLAQFMDGQAEARIRQEDVTK